MQMMLKAAFAAMCLLFCTGSQAMAQSCTASFTSIVFGNVDVTANSTIDNTGTLTVSCTGTKGKTVRVCPNLGLGSGGADNSGANRYMVAGAVPLAFNIYSNAARTVVWGSYVSGFTGVTPPTISVALGTTGTGSATATLYARLMSGQQTTPIGSYVSTFSGSDVQVQYAYAANGACGAQTGFSVTSTNFTVTAGVIARCTVSATTMNFGSLGLLSTGTSATNVFSIVCTTSAPYSVGLDGGLSAAANPAARKMTLGSQSVTYGIYQNSAHTQPWGNSTGVNTYSSTGTGSTQRFIGFGYVPAQTTPSPGSYSDTVVVTVTY